MLTKATPPPPCSSLTTTPSAKLNFPRTRTCFGLVLTSRPCVHHSSMWHCTSPGVFASQTALPGWPCQPHSLTHSDGVWSSPVRTSCAHVFVQVSDAASCLARRWRRAPTELRTLQARALTGSAAFFTALRVLRIQFSRLRTCRAHLRWPRRGRSSF